MSRQTATRWLLRYVQRSALSLAFSLVMIQGLYWIIWVTGGWWWLLAAAGVFVVSILAGQLIPVLILPMFYKIERLEDDELLGRFEQLAAPTSLKIEGVYRMNLSRETVKANAMLTGLGRTRRVILGDTLLDDFSHDEIEVVLAHEVGHHVFRHIPQLIGLGVATSLLSFYICDRVIFRWVLWQDGSFDYTRLPVYTLSILMFATFCLSWLSGPIRNALSRRFERQCDRYALQRTGKRAAFQSAFRKLSVLNKADPDPHPLEVFLLHDHPPISERLAMADSS